jgi:hypothetical protein
MWMRPSCTGAIEQAISISFTGGGFRVGLGAPSRICHTASPVMIGARMRLRAFGKVERGREKPSMRCDQAMHASLSASTRASRARSADMRTEVP